MLGNGNKARIGSVSSKWEHFHEWKRPTETMRPGNGVQGYYEFCKALKDPTHEEHESFVEWSGGEYDNEQFDSDTVNWELMKYLRWSRDRYQNRGGIE